MVPRLAPGTGGHWTRDIAFSPDGRRMFVSVGSASNVAAALSGPPPPGLAEGAAWGSEAGRADVLAFDPDGRDRTVWATGLRNCAALAIGPGQEGDGGGASPWCATNERDGLGDDLVPDYLAELHRGAFYGWPWYYIGDHQDPRHADQRPDLAGRVRVPDVLIQAHSAPLGLVFYHAPPGAAHPFPPAYEGEAFVALHGSWNRAARTGYKLVRARFEGGRPTGAYEDFLTGLVRDSGHVWGRPVGVAVAADGSLLVGEDANGTIWRIARGG
jgi:glucose/arabinose dehydrogenase